MWPNMHCVGARYMSKGICGLDSLMHFNNVPYHAS